MIILCLECPGATFDEAFKSAQRVAIILQLTVEFNFNGVNVLVRSDSDLDDVSKRYRRELRELSCRVSSKDAIPMDVRIMTSIAQAAADAVNLANEKQLRVVFDFNDVAVWADPGESAQRVVQRWEEA